MPGRREKHYRLYIIAENKFIIIGPVEQEIEINFGVCLRDSLQRLISKQPNAFQLIFDEETGINGYALACWHG